MQPKSVTSTGNDVDSAINLSGEPGFSPKIARKHLTGMKQYVRGIFVLHIIPLHIIPLHIIPLHIIPLHIICFIYNSSSCTIRLNGQDIKHVNECKFLGIYLDTHLIWKRHIERISSKISSTIFAINRARDCLSKHALRCLYFALVHSHLTYGIHVWGNSMKI